MSEAIDAVRVQETAAKIRENVQNVIVGKDEAINMSLVALLCKGHLLMEDVPGTGKTTMAKALAQSLGCDFHRIQCTPDLMPTDVLGVNFYNQKTSEFEFRPGPIFSQVVLTDEINRATPRTQSSLLEAMQERQVTVDGVTSTLAEPFLVMATQNPVEMEGTFPLPEAQLDRFMIRVEIGYPTADEEANIYSRFEKDAVPPTLEAVTSAEELSLLQGLPPNVRVEENVRDYIVALITATRDDDSFALGASPRAGLALYKTSQAWAAIDGRDYVTPDDVKKMARSVLPHRMILASAARLRGSSAEQVVDEMLTTIPVPIER
jgi:MoxR-like ATPase|tara:strand:+ start:151 stop:1110 length:960 start_codon:yes stop_codon:yes gene_type:complete